MDVQGQPGLRGGIWGAPTDRRIPAFRRVASGCSRAEAVSSCPLAPSGRRGWRAPIGRVADWPRGVADKGRRGSPGRARVPRECRGVPGRVARAIPVRRDTGPAGAARGAPHPSSCTTSTRSTAGLRQVKPSFRCERLTTPACGWRRERRGRRCSWLLGGSGGTTGTRGRTRTRAPCRGTSRSPGSFPTPARSSPRSRLRRVPAARRT
jgi:hypothetical protein